MAKIYDQTFMQWIEDMLRTGYQLPRATIAVSQNTWKKNWTIQVRPVSADDDSEDLKAAVAIGDDQEIKDIGGVNLVIPADKFLENPKGTFRKILESLQNDILNLDELGTTKGAKIMGNVVRGNLQDNEGRDLRKAQSLILQAIGLRGPSLLTANGDRAFKLIVDSTPTSPNTKLTDRRSFELQEPELPAELQSYKKMALAMINLAENEEETGDRIVARNNVQQEFSRSLVRELNVDPLKTFSWSKKIKGEKHTGSIDKWLTSHKGQIPSYGSTIYVHDMAEILEIPEANFNAFSEPTKKYLGLWVESEKYSRMITGNESFTGTVIREKADANLGIRIVNPENYADTRNVYPSWMNDKTKEAWANFSKDGLMSVKPGRGRLNKYQELRDSYFKQGRFDEFLKLSYADIGLGLDGTPNYRLKNMWADDLNYLREQKLVMQHIIYQIDAPRIRADVYQATLAATGSVNDARAAVDRLEALQNANKLSHDLTAHATVKGLLESLHEGKFASIFFIASRYAASMPLLSKNHKAFATYVKFLDRDTYANLIDTSPIGKALAWAADPRAGTKEAIVKAPVLGWATTLGLTYAGNHKVGLMRLPIFSQASDLLLQNQHFVLHEKYALDAATGKMKSTGIWSTMRLKAGEFDGFFNGKKFVDSTAGRVEKSFGIFDLIKDMEDNKDSFGLTYLLGGDVNEFFTNSQNMLDLRNSLQYIKDNNDIATFLTSASGVGPGARPILNVPPNRWGAILDGMGAQRENLDLIKNIDSYIESLDMLVPVDAAGNIVESKFFKMINRLVRKGKVEPDQIWIFLTKLKASNKGSNLLLKYIGPLDLVSRYANLGHDFLFKSIIWGRMLDGISGARPLKTLIRSFSSPDGINLVRSAQNWPLVKRVVDIGTAMQKVSGLGGAVAITEGQAALTSMVGGRATSLIMRAAASRALGSTVVNLGVLLTKAASLATGPISWVLAIFGKTAFSASIKILRGDMRGAIGVVKSDIRGLWITTKKFVLYPIFLVIAVPCSCLLGIVVFIIMILIPTGLAPYEPTTAGVSSILNSQLITVTKTEVVGSGGIPGLGLIFKSYKIEVKNISTKPVTIASFTDDLSLLMGCDPVTKTGLMYKYGEPGFVGQLFDGASGNNITTEQIAGGFIGVTLQPNESAEATVSLKNIIQGEDATYYNIATASVKEEPGRSASGVVSSIIGDGGCSTCPETWPTCSPGTICTQPISYGPNDPQRFYSNGNNRTHWNTEATDLAVAYVPVYATHDGETYVGNDPGGYGNYVVIKSLMGFQSIVAHLSAVNISAGTIKKGDLIGTSGSTGNSSGPHVHYEFKRINGGYPACLPNQPVIMDLPYIPVAKENLRIWPL
jgi:hypothetical protein